VEAFFDFFFAVVGVLSEATDVSAAFESAVSVVAVVDFFFFVFVLLSASVELSVDLALSAAVALFDFCLGAGVSEAAELSVV
jgi:hypothetical protein